MDNILLFISRMQKGEGETRVRECKEAERGLELERTNLGFHKILEK